MREGRFGWVFSTSDPLAALQALAREWRWELEPKVVGITGSTGKTSVKDIAKTLLPFRVHASPENYNTEIGLPLAILAAPPGTEVLVLEMAMRGVGQIAELCEIAEPDVGVITNVGPVHLELLGTLEAIAEAKAEILSASGPRAARSCRWMPRRSNRISATSWTSSRSGPAATCTSSTPLISGRSADVLVGTPAGEQRFVLPFAESYNVTNALAAIAIGVSLGADLAAMARRAADITFSRLRGEHHELRGGITLVNDCYNANPISMHAALESLAEMPGTGRKVAVLGGMAELGPDAATYHREIGALARGLGIAPGDRSRRDGPRLRAGRVGAGPGRGGGAGRRTSSPTAT